MTFNVVAGSDHEYPMRHAGPGNDDYFLSAVEHGDPAGVWWGAGAALLGLFGEVSAEQMETVYRDLRHPGTGAQLGTAPRRFADAEVRVDRALAKLYRRNPVATAEEANAVVARAERSPLTAVRFLDATFSMPKSWSVAHAALEAAGRSEEAALVWAALMAGAAAGLEFLQAEAGFSRAGYHGVEVGGRTSGRWEEAHDFTVSRWRHHTNRDGEPHLHVHQLILNRVLCADGVYRSLDSRAHTKARAGAAAVAELVAEGELTRTLGARFARSVDGKDREIVGVPVEAVALFSGRRRAIKAEAARVIEEWEKANGRPMSVYGRSVVQQEATLKDRKSKAAHPESRSQMLRDWEVKVRADMASSLLTVAVSVGFDTRNGRVRDFDVPALVDVLMEAGVGEKALSALEDKRGVWSRYDLMMEVRRALPDSVSGLSAVDALGLLNGMTDRLLAPGGMVTSLTAPAVVEPPPEFRRADGRSVYEPHRPESYATLSHLAREEELVKVARSAGAPVAGAVSVAAASARAGLSSDQREAVSAIAGSGRWLEVLIGPAGTGKSRTVGALAAGWEASGVGRVMGLAVSEAAARVLAGEGLPRAANTTRFLSAQERLSIGRPYRDDARDFGVAKGDLLILDEASMVGTAQLAAIVGLAQTVGAKVLLVGDDRQLASVGAGGAMGLVTREVGAHELVEVRRFSAGWEGAASLGLRQGDAAALVAYDTEGRLVEGEREAMMDGAFRAVTADLLAGRDAVLIAPTNEVAADLASRVRASLVAAGLVESGGAELGDGNLAGRGDLVQARKNDREVLDTDDVPVRNRDVLRVLGVRDDGGLLVHRTDGADHPALLVLPPEYVASSVDLAYAVTQHGAQGRTTTAGYSLVDESVGREGFYVGMTRGRERNVAFVVVEGEGAADKDRFSVLGAALEREGADVSASDVLREEFAAAESLARLGQVWSDVVGTEAKERLGREIGEALGAEHAARFAVDDAAPSVFRLLRGVELAGGDPVAEVRAAVSAREFDTAESVAQVLHFRLGGDPRVIQSEAVGSFVQRSPDGDSPAARFARSLGEAMDRRVDVLGLSAAMEPPAWAVELGRCPDAGEGREAWIARAGAVAAYREEYGYAEVMDPIGARPSAGEVERRASWHRASSALGRDAQVSDVAALGSVELEEKVARYQREVFWAPPNVDDLLRGAATAEREWEVVAVEAEHVLRDPGQAEAARVLADDLGGRAARLREAAAVRRRWLDESADAREAARAAAVELARRGVDVDVPVGGDRVTAPGVVHDPATVAIESAAAARADEALALMVDRDLAVQRERAERVVAEERERGLSEWERVGPDERERSL